MYKDLFVPMIAQMVLNYYNSEFLADNS